MQMLPGIEGEDSGHISSHKQLLQPVCAIEVVSLQLRENMFHCQSNAVVCKYLRRFSVPSQNNECGAATSNRLGAKSDGWIHKLWNMMPSVTSLHFIILLFFLIFYWRIILISDSFIEIKWLNYLARQKLSLISGTVVYCLFHPSENYLWKCFYTSKIFGNLGLCCMFLVLRNNFYRRITARAESSKPVSPRSDYLPLPYWRNIVIQENPCDFFLSTRQFSLVLYSP